MFRSLSFIARMAALLALPALFTAEPVVAAAAVDAPPTVTVRYDDLDLNGTQGVAALYQRIETAATEVCRSAEGPQSLGRMHWTAWNECFYHAIGKAVKAVHNEKLSAYHWRRIRGWGYQEPATGVTAARR